MSPTPRSDFPVFPAGRVRALGESKVMLDGMEVLFDQKVDLAPVMLVPKSDSREPIR
jgi:hypothetical protein